KIEWKALAQEVLDMPGDMGNVYNWAYDYSVANQALLHMQGVHEPVATYHIKASWGVVESSGHHPSKAHRPPVSPTPASGAHAGAVAGGVSVVGVRSGTVNQKVDPWPGALSTPTSPPWRSTMDLLIARPKPRLTPEPLCTLTVSIREKRSHTCVCSLSDRPGPASRTATRATRAWPPSSLSPSSAPSSASTTTSTGRPGGEYLSALLR